MALTVRAVLSRVEEASSRRASRWVKADRLHPLIPRETPRWRKLYRGRASVEREFGRLKNEWALLRLRIRGLDLVALHADLTILASAPAFLPGREPRPGRRSAPRKTTGPAVGLLCA